MQLGEINNQIKHLPQEGKDAILHLIDIKTNNDMEKVMSSIESLKEAMLHLERSVEKTVDNKINTLYWVLGVVGAIITLAVSIAIALISS